MNKKGRNNTTFMFVAILAVGYVLFFGFPEIEEDSPTAPFDGVAAIESTNIEEPAPLPDMNYTYEPKSYTEEDGTGVFEMGDLLD